MSKKAFRIVEDRDTGFKAFFDGVKGLKGKRAKVGIQGREADQIHPGGISMVALGAVHEFGSPTQNIPQRSFLRSTADANRGKYERILAKGAVKLVKDPKAFSAEGTLFRLGERVRADVVNRIENRQIEPQRREGDPSADPSLVDEGLLVGSIRSVVK